jgi:hypothetical protein
MRQNMVGLQCVCYPFCRNGTQIDLLWRILRG